MNSRLGLGVFGAIVFMGGLGTGWAMGRSVAEAVQSRVALDNQRVTVTEVTFKPGARREPYIRPVDQVVVFIEEASYDATDASGVKQSRTRAAGEVIWHSKGEAAPLLINTGAKPFRNLVIALK